MDQSKALHQLTEAADLIGMLEAITAAGSNESMSSASWSGVRITLRNLRDMILKSHDTLAADLVARARAKLEQQGALASAANGNGSQHAAADESAADRSKAMAAAEAQGIKMQRKDLRASLERLIDR